MTKVETIITPLVDPQKIKQFLITDQIHFQAKMPNNFGSSFSNMSIYCFSVLYHVK